MQLIKPSYEIITEVDGGMLSRIEDAGRTCYKSESKGNPSDFCEMILKRGHESVIEHERVSVRFIIDRGVSHELVRHRLCAFSQESTRYCNYNGGVTFIIPPWCTDIEPGEYTLAHQYCKDEYVWYHAMWYAELSYLDLLEKGWTPQQARSVLPNSLKTEIVCTANLREWRHIFNLRCSPKAHPQMREVMQPLQQDFIKLLPEIFK